MIIDPGGIFPQRERHRTQADRGFSKRAEALALRRENFQPVVRRIQRIQVAPIRGQRQRANRFGFKIRKTF